MTKISFILFLFCMISCSSDIDKNNLYLTDGTYIVLEEDETVNELTKENTDLYFSYVGNSEIQAPLYKHINNDGYQLFIGIPIDKDFNTIKSMINTNDAIEGTIESISASYMYSNYDVDSYNITKYLVEVDKKIVLMIIVSDSKKKLEVSKLENFKNRIIKE